MRIAVAEGKHVHAPLNVWSGASGDTLAVNTTQAAGLEQFEPASTECRALREAAHAAAGASIATSLAAAVATHLAASLGVISTACDAV